MQSNNGVPVLSEYKKEDIQNHIKLYNKWVFRDLCPLDDFEGFSRRRMEAPNVLDYRRHKEKVLIWTGPAWEPWDKQKVDEGMAGSETWAAYLAREFVRSGYDAYVYNDLRCADKTTDKVLDPVIDSSGKNHGSVVYRDHTMMLKDIEYMHVDHFISSRSTEPLHFSLHTGRHYVMAHDIWLSNDRNYDLMTWKVQRYAYLSDWHKEFLVQHHRMPVDKMFLTANGVAQELYTDVDTYQKKCQMIYSSSPDRGLYQLLQMIPRIRESVPEFQLLVSYGFFNWESSAQKRNDVSSLALIGKIKKLMDQPGVLYLDRVNKADLAKHQMESKVWLYPSWFTETFCIGAVENGLSKNALLTTDLAGLKSTVGSAGQLMSPGGLSRDGEYPKEFQDEFVTRAVKLLTDEDLRKEWAEKAYQKMQAYRWENIASEWIRQFRSPA